MLRRALLFKYGWRGGLDQAVELGCDAVHPHFRLLDAVTKTGDHGLSVNAWTPSDSRDVAYLWEVGVDSAIVDD